MTGLVELQDWHSVFVPRHKGVHFHAHDKCRKVRSEKGPKPRSVKSARWAGLTPCPICLVPLLKSKEGELRDGQPNIKKSGDFGREATPPSENAVNMFTALLDEETRRNEPDASRGE